MANMLKRLPTGFGLLTGGLTNKLLPVLLLSVALILPHFGAFGQDVTNDDNDAGDDDEESMKSVVVLLFMFFGLAVGIMVTQFLSIVGEAVPYTCVVFLLGVLFAVASNSGGMIYAMIFCFFD